MTVDTFPGHTLRGHVQSFAPASGALFALLPPDNATGNFTKVVQRISVKIVIDDADGLTDRLVPGMSVVARVYAADRRRDERSRPARFRHSASAGILAPTLPSPPTSIPWLGLLAVLLGTFIATLNTRLSSFGLADIRGAVSAGFDEGAWITTAQTAAQMFVTVPAVWMGAAFGPRRVLMGASIAFAVVSPHHARTRRTCRRSSPCSFSGARERILHSAHPELHFAQYAPEFWAFGIAIYALNLELSLNISASLEGWYVDHHSWRWIYWQNVPLALAMSLCLRQGIAIKPISVRPPFDLFGLVMAGAGLALIYAALDQGNRLDWLNSGLEWGLLGAGTLVFIGLLRARRRAPPDRCST